MTHLAPETIERLLDGDLSPAERAAAEAHLAGCAGCAEELAALAALFADLAALPDSPPPIDLVPAVLARVAPPAPWGARAWALLVAQAALALALALALAPLLGAGLAAAEAALRGLAPLAGRLPAWEIGLARLWELMAAAGAGWAPGPLGRLGAGEWALLIGVTALVWLALNGFLLGRGEAPQARESEVQS